MSSIWNERWQWGPVWRTFCQWARRCDGSRYGAPSGRDRRHFRRPGHIFPLIAKKGGVLRREGHTEAAVDLAQIADAEPVGVLCEVIKEDGAMACVPDLEKLAKQHGLKMIPIRDLIRYRCRREKLVTREVSVQSSS